MQNWFLSETYIPYALGGGYVLAAPLVHYVARTMPLLVRDNSEVRRSRGDRSPRVQDVSMGAWLAPLHLTRRHDVRFDTEWRVRGRACGDPTHRCRAAAAAMPTSSHTSRRRPTCAPSTPRCDMRRHPSHTPQLLASGGAHLCTVESVVARAYEYDWSKPPSQCCIKPM